MGSDRRIAAARKVEQDSKLDTWPAPPPSSASALEELPAESHDTIPTPPPESGVADIVVIPPMPDVDLGDASDAK